MKYSLEKKKNTGVFVLAVYLAAMAIFFSLCNMTFNSKTGLHPTLVSFRSGKYFYVDLLLFLSPVFSLLCVFASRIKPVFASASPVFLMIYALYSDAIDNTLNNKLYIIIPCVAAVIITFVTLRGFLHSGVPAVVICAFCSLAFILEALFRIPQLFYYKSGYDGYYIYISRMICHIIPTLLPGLVCLGFTYEGAEDKNTKYESIVEGDIMSSDALKEKSAVTKDDDFLK